MHPSALVSRPHSITDVDVDHAPWNLPRQQAVADVADGEFVQGMLQRMLQEEENNGFQSSSQVLSGNEHGPPVISGSHLQNLGPNYVWGPESPDDFLEEKDLVGSEFSSTLSSENTCVPSMTLDGECFDPEALLRELAPSAQLQNTVSAPRRSHQVVIQPPPSGSVGGSSSNNIKNPLVMKIVVSVSVPSIYIGGLNHAHPPAAASFEELPDVGASQEQGSPLQRRPKRGRSSLQLEGRSSKVSRTFV
eukprot:TRINITY_DN6174_c0_g1_i4.p1 TRINITY_DN6174_c0_g1~~TRINITY_DN6174_c0_g1_i4.p1  ORF type:complete len:248 (+),score=74.78 TRINITY_DN6174_c0_g1_i4:192-935(+)